MSKLLSDTFTKYPLGQLRPNHNDPRADEPADEQLAASLEENGQTELGVVRKISDGVYEILSGNRRYKALTHLAEKEAKKEKPRQIFFEAREFIGEEKHIDRVVAITNSYRKDFSIAQKAALIERMLLTMSPQEVAKSIGARNAVEVYNFKKLVESDAANEIFEAVQSGIINPTTAFKIAAAPDAKAKVKEIVDIATMQKKLADKAAKEGKTPPKTKTVAASAVVGGVKVESRLNTTDMTLIVQSGKLPEAVATWILANHFNEAESISVVKSWMPEGLEEAKSQSAAQKALAKEAKAKEASNSEAPSFANEAEAAGI